MRVAQLTMSNINRGSKLLWVHCVMTWVVSLLVYSVRAHALHRSCCVKVPREEHVHLHACAP